jgi:GNAT superfamily N-acetyltransferase
MWWRLPGQEYSRKAGAGTSAALKRITKRRPPGILAYHNRIPIGWCSVAPRADFMPRLSRWTPFRRGAEALNGETPAVWAIVCFFVDRAYRGKRVADRLLREAARYAAQRGAAIVEAYPVDAAARSVTVLSAYTGTVTMFRRAGFREVVRAYPARPIMRRRPSLGRRATG